MFTSKTLEKLYDDSNTRFQMKDGTQVYLFPLTSFDEYESMEQFQYNFNTYILIRIQLVDRKSWQVEFRI